jgi:hypothetical protein
LTWSKNLVFYHYPFLPSLRVLLCGSHGVLCAASRPKPVTVFDPCRDVERGWASRRKVKTEATQLSNVTLRMARLEAILDAA